MADVCVITGGGSGMGLAAAKFIDKDKILVISGRTVSKLEGAVKQLEALGHEVHACRCDVADENSVKELATYAAGLGCVKQVLHCAGMSPNMSDGATLLKVNALGTVHVNREFATVMKDGGVIVDVSSNSAYALPGFLVKLASGKYPLAEKDETKFVASMMKFANLAKGDYAKAGFAYALSKNFVCWYAKKSAFDLGLKGIRVVSVSPGLIDTDMGKLEKEEGAALIPFAAEKRMGLPEELGFCIASVADERNGYLAGVDVLCDGGSTNGKEFRKKA